MANMFDVAAKKLKGSPIILLFFVVALIMFGLGVVFFVEDTISSFNGVKQLEAVYGIKPVNHWVTYIAISIAPQIAQLGLMYFFLTNPRKNGWMPIMAFLFLLVDFASDLQDRSNGQFVIFNGGIVELAWNPTIIASAFFTLMYFTIGSELFISVSVGLLLSLFPDAINQYTQTFTRTRAALKKANADIKKAHRAHGTPRKKQKQNGQHVGQRHSRHEQHTRHNQGGRW